VNASAPPVPRAVAPVNAAATPAAAPSSAITQAVVADTHEADLQQCLSKEYRPDRSIVFHDNCTHESASVPAPNAAPESRSSNPKPSVVVEPAIVQDDAPQQIDGP
jgi:hypothetical protein